MWTWPEPFFSLPGLGRFEAHHRSGAMLVWHVIKLPACLPPKQLENVSLHSNVALEEGMDEVSRRTWDMESISREQVTFKRRATEQQQPIHGNCMHVKPFFHSLGHCRPAVLACRLILHDLETQSFWSMSSILFTSSPFLKESSSQNEYKRHSHAADWIACRTSLARWLRHASKWPGPGREKNGSTHSYVWVTPITKSWPTPGPGSQG